MAYRVGSYIPRENVASLLGILPADNDDAYEFLMRLCLLLRILA